MPLVAPLGGAADPGCLCVGASRRRVDRSKYVDPEMPEFPGAVFINHIGCRQPPPHSQSPPNYPTNNS